MPSNVELASHRRETALLRLERHRDGLGDGIVVDRTKTIFDRADSVHGLIGALLSRLGLPIGSRRFLAGTRQPLESAAWAAWAALFARTDAILSTADRPHRSAQHAPRSWTPVQQLVLLREQVSSRTKFLVAQPERVIPPTRMRTPRIENRRFELGIASPF